MIRAYTGELLAVPPLAEISGNSCSHNCSYCFANVRKVVRVAKPKSVTD